MGAIDKIDSGSGALAAPQHRRRTKAAMIVRLMLAEGVRPSFADFPEELQLSLARELAALRSVDSATLAQVANEFASELDSLALTASGGVEAALAELGDQLSPKAANRLRTEISGTPRTDPWSVITALDPLKLVQLMEDERIEVCAVTLSKLPVAKAAEVLRLLKGERARLIAHAVSRTGGVSPEAVSRIGAALAQNYTQSETPAFPQPAAQRVGAILNSSGAELRDKLLSDLEGDDPAFAQDLRKAIFTFADIPARLDPLAIPKVLRGLDQADLVRALAFAASEGGAAADAASFVLDNMSKRMAEQIREEIQLVGKVRRVDGETAQTALITEIRAVADSGEITLRTEETEDDQ